MLFNHFLEVVIKIEVKDNNIEQALRVLRENFRGWFFKVIKLKKSRETLREKEKNSSENIKRVKIK